MSGPGFSGLLYGVLRDMPQKPGKWLLFSSSPEVLEGY